MRERHQQRPSRLDMIQATGIVPEPLLFQMGENGIQHDYANHWVGPMMTVKLFNPLSPRNLLTAPDAKDTLRGVIGATATYSDYWRKKLAVYNEYAQGPDRPKVTNIDAAFDLLVTQQPKSGALDILAGRAQDLANSDIDPAILVLSYVKLAAQAYILLYDDNRRMAKELLREFGLIGKDSVQEK